MGHVDPQKTQKEKNQPLSQQIGEGSPNEILQHLVDMKVKV